MLCLLLTVWYVSSLYMIPYEVRRRNRDDVLHIKYRLFVVVLATISSLIAVYYVLSYKFTSKGYKHAMDLSLYYSMIGFRMDNNVQCIACSIMLMSIFYLGPITVAASKFITSLRYHIGYDGRLSLLDKKKGMLQELKVCMKMLSMYDVIAIRAFIIAPITEEIVFRGLMISLMYMNATTAATATTTTTSVIDRNWNMAVMCPLWFGVAHIHHMVELIRQGRSIKSVVVQTVLQFTYTYIFGVIACVLFLRTGNIITPIISHVYCNYMGLPDVGFMTAAADELSFLHPCRYLLIVLHALGLLLFAYLVVPMTAPFISTSSVYWIQ